LIPGDVPNVLNAIKAKDIPPDLHNLFNSSLEKPTGPQSFRSGNVSQPVNATLMIDLQNVKNGTNGNENSANASQISLNSKNFNITVQKVTNDTKMNQNGTQFEPNDTLTKQNENQTKNDESLNKTISSTDVENVQENLLDSFSNKNKNNAPSMKPKIEPKIGGPDFTIKNESSVVSVNESSVQINVPTPPPLNTDIVPLTEEHKMENKPNSKIDDNIITKLSEFESNLAQDLDNEISTKMPFQNGSGNISKDLAIKSNNGKIVFDKFIAKSNK